MLFPKARELMEQHPDAKRFCEIALKLLNGSLRPYTARWHRWMTEFQEEAGSPKLRFRDELARRMFRSASGERGESRFARGEDTKRNLKHVGYLFSLVKARRKLLT